MKTITINNKIWSLREELPNCTLWTADYFCSDGDSIELYIEKDSFELHCFSGIGCSKIIIDRIDFGVFHYTPNKIANLDFNEPFDVQCIKIADYFCNKFCE